MIYITFTRINIMKKKMAQIQKTIQKQKLFYYKKLRLTDDYQYESEEEEKGQQASKRPDQKIT